MNRKICGAVLGFFVVMLFGLHHWGGGVGIAHGAVGPTVESAASAVGAAAPDFTLPDLGGASIKLSTYKGNKPVLIYFWATWCPYCIAAKPRLAEIRKEISESDLQILGINVGGGDSLERVKKYQQAHPAPYPILFDGDSALSRAYQVIGIPMFIVVDKEGKIVYRSNALPKDVKQLLLPK